MTNKDAEWMYNTVLKIPSMEEPVKIHLNMSRKVALMLSQVIVRGLKGGRGDEELYSYLPPEANELLEAIANETLEKAGLVGLSENLKRPFSNSK